MSSKLVTLTTFTYISEAFPLMTKLNDEGIECYTGNENVLAIDPFLSNAIGGLKLQVKETDLSKAALILTIFNQQINADRTGNDPKWEKDFVAVDTWCPVCESGNVYRRKFPWHKTLLAVVMSLLYIPWLFLTKKHYCADCGHQWKR